MKRSAGLDWAGVVAVALAGFALAYRAELESRAELPVRADAPLSRQLARAAEPGHGRRASTPFAIPWAGWKDILLRTYREIQDDRIMALAAGIVFYSLLALFPAVTAGVSIFGLFADAHSIAQNLTVAGDIIPAGGLDIVRDQVARIVSKGGGALTLGFVFGLGLALWSANAGIKSIIDALNISYGETEKRGFFALNALSLLFTLCAIALALLLVAGVIVAPLLVARFGITSGQAALAYARWPLMYAITVLAFAVLYRHGPSRSRPQWQWVIVGAIAAASLWLVMSSLFSFYLSRFANYDATYGSLGAVIALMMWMWLSAIVVLAGSELNAEIEHQTARDSTTGAPQPLGERGAMMADTVGVAHK